MSENDEDYEGMLECANCGGHFFPEDMDGEHCQDCVEELFGDDA